MRFALLLLPFTLACATLQPALATPHEPDQAVAMPVVFVDGVEPDAGEVHACALVQGSFRCLTDEHFHTAMERVRAEHEADAGSLSL